MALFETEVPIRRVITTDPERARAVENDLRAKVLDILADDAHTIEEIREELARRGEDKAETTVRHHVDVLQDAGLVEIARLEDAGGGTRKYYESNTRVFSYDLPEDADERLAAAEETASQELSGVLETLVAEHGDEIASVARETRPCEYCETQRYEEFVLRELIERSLVRLDDDGTLDELL